MKIIFRYVIDIGKKWYLAIEVPQGGPGLELNSKFWCNTVLCILNDGVNPSVYIREVT